MMSKNVKNMFLCVRWLTCVIFLMGISFSLFAQQNEHVVNGQVLNEKGEPIQGATVKVEGSTRGVLADEKGKYSIAVDKTGKLIYSYVGFATQTLSVEGRTEINLTLLPLADVLDEVTVVAFGQQKKESVVGSITTVKPSELKVPSSNLTTALAGRVAGLIAFQQSGEPGADNADFFIRGVTSFGYSNRPLILVDGIEMPASELARLQVDDIASFSIMKDASATALYGARGANGVILITSKEGREGKASISVRYETSLSSPTKKIELADPITYMLLTNEAALARGEGLTVYSQQKIDKTIEGSDPLIYPATDWHSLLMKDQTINSRLNLNVNGGGKVARYYVAATYNKDNGLLKVDKRNNFNNNIDLKTYGLRSNININLTSSTEAIVRLNSTWTDYNGPISGGADLYEEIMNTNPVLYPAYYLPDANNATTKHILFGNYDKGQYNNPYASVMRGYKDYTNAQFLAQFEIKQKLDFITKGLNLSAMYNTTRYNFYQVSRQYTPFSYIIASYDKNTKEYTLQNINPEQGHEYLTYAENAKNISSEMYFQGILGYNREFNEKHTVSSTLVYTMLNRLEANAGSLQNSLPHRNLGIAGRATYAYDRRYFIEGNFGYNGSERFHKDRRYGFFPSIGAAWYISNEKFWNDNIKNIVSNLKLKGTFGLVGNDAIGSVNDRFFFLSVINPNFSGRSYVFGTELSNQINGVQEQRYENPAITWERSTKTNLGLELGLFKSLNIIADFYKEKRTNILMPRSHIPATLGLESVPVANVGEASSKGMDLSLEYSKGMSSGLYLSGRANFTYATSKYLIYDEPDYSAVPWRSRIGLPIGQQFGYVAERLFVDDKEVLNSPQQFGQVIGGDIKYKDIDGDGVITELDQVPIGYPTVPEIVYGFGMSASYRNFDASFFFQGQARNSFWIDPVATHPFVGSGGSTRQLLKAYADDHWSEDNQDLYALWPRLSREQNTNNVQKSTWFMRNGSFLRLKQVEFGYSFSQKSIARIGIQKVRIYLNGSNLMNWSIFKLWDSEMGGNGLKYPLQRVFNFGIQCSI